MLYPHPEPLTVDLRPFGQTGLSVPVLGFGAGPLGDERLSEADAERLLRTALDAGCTFLDTAPSYGISEERIGRYLADRREEVVLSTKVGYGIPGVTDWTAEAVTRGVERARRRMKADVLDVVHLHSCPLQTLEEGAVVDALNEAVAAGHVRVAAYSGENDELAWAVQSGRFGSVQTSLNVFDQHDVAALVPEAKAAGLGVVAKRPNGNAPWRYAERPVGEYAEAYWTRMTAMGLDFGEGWAATALRFAAHHTGADVAIVGTTNPEHLRQNAAAVEAGPLPERVIAEIRAAFSRHGAGWDGQI